MQKSILITGCSSGIGYDAAGALRARGWRVFAACRKAEDCARLIEEGFESPRIDYQDPASIAQGLAEVRQATGGPLDALFNNGAYAIPSLVEDLPTDALRQIFEANFFGWHELTRQAIPALRAAPQGRIIQCSSVLGLVGMQFRGAYVATKFALEGLTDTLRLEMQSQNIHVVLIEPGPITTEIRRNAIPHFERWIDWQASHRRAKYERILDRLYQDRGPDTFELPPAAVTKKLIHALEAKRPRARYYVTTPTYVMSALRRILPTSALDWVARRG